MPYHSICNGLVKNFNVTLKKMQRRLCNEQPRQWHRFVNLARAPRCRNQTNFYWPGTQDDITSFCRSGDLCQKTIAKGFVPHVLLGDMTLIDMSFRKVAVDLVEPILSLSARDIDIS